MSTRRAGGLSHEGIVRIGEEQYACKVTNMSASGAVLMFRGPVDLPARFTLMLTPLGNVMRACTVTWEEGEQIGVVFGDASPDGVMSGVEPFTLRTGVPDDFAAMAQISVGARARYRTMTGLGYIADRPPVAEHRFRQGCSIVAVTPAKTIAGFVLTRTLGGLLLLDNISTSSEFRGQGLGDRLLHAVLKQATAERYPAVVLTTFREPRWNGPWFRKFGFLPMPDDSIGPELRALIEQQSGYLDPRTRETLWRRFH